MTLTKEAKLEIVGKHGKHDGDTGSAEVQIALLTTRINQLTDHLRNGRPIAQGSRLGRIDHPVIEPHQLSGFGELRR